MMKKILVALMMGLMVASGAYAQKKKQENIILEQSQTRFVEPEIRVFIKPMVSDLTMLSTERQYYGPYMMRLSKPFPNISQYMIDELKKNALYLANRESDSDIMVGCLFHVTIDENEPNVLRIDVSGYPAQYSNFHLINLNDEQELKMVNIMYGNYEWIRAMQGTRTGEAAVE